MWNVDMERDTFRCNNKSVDVEDKAKSGETQLILPFHFCAKPV